MQSQVQAQEVLVVGKTCLQETVALLCDVAAGVREGPVGCQRIG